MNNVGVFFIIAIVVNSALGRIEIFTFLDQFPNPQNPSSRQPSQQTTQITPTSGTEGPMTVTTQSPEVRNCIRNCPVTSEYNPVCGSDKNTYDNPGRLKCAQGCGLDVTMLWASRCTVPDQF